MNDYKPRWTVKPVSEADWEKWLEAHPGARRNPKPRGRPKMKDTDGPWHIVARLSKRHAGPFTTEVDAAMARQIAGAEFRDGTLMDAAQFIRWRADR